ncbi:hypothetical protein K438DRAFT_1925035 [Mycena galopus ATCC 62051]|nr:hypothetical protein K438DRAFT_1925035 [Mycena galopus ATCC 62051]
MPVLGYACKRALRPEPVRCPHGERNLFIRHSNATKGFQNRIGRDRRESQSTEPLLTRFEYLRNKYTKYAARKASDRPLRQQISQCCDKILLVPHRTRYTPVLSHMLLYSCYAVCKPYASRSSGQNSGICYIYRATQHLNLSKESLEKICLGEGKKNVEILGPRPSTCSATVGKREIALFGSEVVQKHQRNQIGDLGDQVAASWFQTAMLMKSARRRHSSTIQLAKISNIPRPINRTNHFKTSTGSNLTIADDRNLNGSIDWQPLGRAYTFSPNRKADVVIVSRSLSPPEIRIY